MGVVLSHENENGEEHPILFLSKKFSEFEKCYSATERECATIVFAMKMLRHYLDDLNLKLLQIIMHYTRCVKTHIPSSDLCDDFRTATL